MRFDVISLMPEMFNSLNYGITGRAVKNKLIQLQCWNPRDYTHNVHRTVDDKPYGGGPGMVMMVEPLQETLDAIRKTGNNNPLIYCSPQGEPLNQGLLTELTELPGMILLAGRYEGIDERFIEANVDREISIGDYVLSGGELPAMVMIDGISRLLPGVLGHNESAAQDSFMNGLLDYPHYTRPECINGHCVPKVLLSGDHKAIEAWRKQQAIERTKVRRPDLYELVK